MRHDEGPAQGMRLAEVFTALEEAGRNVITPDHLARLEAIYRQALAEHEAALSLQSMEASRVQAR